jgi:hypothetical protein
VQDERVAQTPAQVTQAQAQAATKPERREEGRTGNVPPQCWREHRRDINMNDWYALLNPPRTARESDCKYICAKGNAKKWCVDSVFSTEDNGSCRLFAAVNQKTHVNMNDWYSPPRPARESDCTYLCEKGNAKAWCVESKFITKDNGSCRLSACNTALCGEKKYTNINQWYDDDLNPRAARNEDCKFMCEATAWCVESKFSTADNGSCTLSSCKAQSLSANVLGEARRHRPYVDMFIVLTVLGIIFFLAVDCIGNCRLSSAKSAKSARSSL